MNESICSHADLQAQQTRRRPPSPLESPPPSRRFRKEKIIHESIRSHADLQALQTRSDQLFVNLVSLESVSIALESFVLLRPLVNLKSWICPKLNFLSLLANLVLELEKVKRDLLPSLLDLEEAKLEGDFLNALLLLRQSSDTLICLGEGFEKLVAEMDGSLEEGLQKDGFSWEVKVVGLSLQDTTNRALRRINKSWLQTRVSCALDLVNSLLATPVSFPE